MTYWDERNNCPASHAPSFEYTLEYSRWVSKRYFNPVGRLLDIGCGNGNFTNSFIKLGYDTIGIDIETIFPSAIKVDLEKGNLPFESESFDYIFFRHTIEHIQNAEGILQECFRVLKKSGKLLIETIDFKISYKTFYDYPQHKRPFTKRSLEFFLKMYGFKIIRLSYFKNIPFVWRYTIKAFDFVFPWNKMILAICEKREVTSRP